ncbi:hypothetical protein Vafri_5068, partial [Volvox africanus]
TDHRLRWLAAFLCRIERLQCKHIQHLGRMLLSHRSLSLRSVTGKRSNDLVYVPRQRQASSSRCRIVSVHAAFTPDNPVRQVLSQVAINVYKVSALISQQETGLSPLWSSLRKLDLSGVNAALRAGSDPNERDATGDTPLLMIARAGHYKYPPGEIPAVGHRLRLIYSSIIFLSNAKMPEFFL